MPPMAAITGRAAVRLSASTPSVRSRATSRPMAKKKTIIARFVMSEPIESTSLDGTSGRWTGVATAVA